MIDTKKELTQHEVEEIALKILNETATGRTTEEASRILNCILTWHSTFENKSAFIKV